MSANLAHHRLFDHLSFRDAKWFLSFAGSSSLALSLTRSTEQSSQPHAQPCAWAPSRHRQALWNISWRDDDAKICLSHPSTGLTRPLARVETLLEEGIRGSTIATTAARGMLAAMRTTHWPMALRRRARSPGVVWRWTRDSTTARGCSCLAIDAGNSACLTLSPGGSEQGPLGDYYKSQRTPKMLRDGGHSLYVWDVGHDLPLLLRPRITL
jgi:hypothetical protein